MNPIIPGWGVCFVTHIQFFGILVCSNDTRKRLSCLTQELYQRFKRRIYNFDERKIQFKSVQYKALIKYNEYLH